MGSSRSKATPPQPADKTLMVDNGAQAGTDPQKPVSGACSALPTIDIKIIKVADNDCIGLEGADYEDCWEVSSVGDGLVKIWNEQHADLIVEVGDKIVSCNGVQGHGQRIRDAMNDAMKEGKELEIKIAKAKIAPPENNAANENHEVSGAPADNVPEPIGAPLDTVPEKDTTETGVQDTTESGVRATVEEDTIDVHGKTDVDDSPVLNGPDQAPNQEAIATIEDDGKSVGHQHEQGWMCSCCNSK